MAARDGQRVLPVAVGAWALQPLDRAQSVPGQDDTPTTRQHDQRGPWGLALKTLLQYQCCSTLRTEADFASSQACRPCTREGPAWVLEGTPRSWQQVWVGGAQGGPFLGCQKGMAGLVTAGDNLRAHSDRGGQLCSPGTGQCCPPPTEPPPTHPHSPPGASLRLPQLIPSPLAVAPSHKLLPDLSDV